MKIQVTQEDIDKGKRESCAGCPIAIAIKRVTGKEVRVYYTAIFFDEGILTTTRKSLPPLARDFIKAFDRGGKVEPFEFEL